MNDLSAKQVIEKYLDSDLLISVAAIRERGWQAIPVPDILNPMEAEWFANALLKYVRCGVVGIAFEYGGNPEIEKLEVSRDSLLAYNGRNSWRSTIITCGGEAFLYYKDEANRYYLLCGDEDFLAEAYRCTLDTARMMYFQEWVDLPHHNSDERRFLTDVWLRYNF